MEWSDIVSRLTGIAHLATVTPSGAPHVSVVSPTVEAGVVWIGTTRSSRKARNLTATPQAALVWQPGAEIYVQADVELVDELAVKHRLWDSGLFSYDPAAFFGSVDNPDFVLLRLAPTSATVMEMTDRGPARSHWRRPVV